MLKETSLNSVAGTVEITVYLPIIKRRRIDNTIWQIDHAVGNKLKQLPNHDFQSR